MKANALFIEAIEYYVLRKLALHLSSYFNDDESFSDDYLVKLDRKSIPDVLMGNRFIDTFLELWMNVSNLWIIVLYHL